MLRGSREYSSPVNGSTMEKLRMSVFSLRNGSRYALVGAGISFMSDSWMAWKPRIEDPSNICPSLKKSASRLLAGTLKCCITPGRSQNRTSTNTTSSSLMNFRTSSALLNKPTSCGGAGETAHDSTGVADDPNGWGFLGHDPNVSPVLHRHRLSAWSTARTLVRGSRGRVRAQVRPRHTRVSVWVCRGQAPVRWAGSGVGW